MQQLVIAAVAAGLLLLGLAFGWLLLRSRRSGRAAAAWCLCEHLDRYLDALAAGHEQSFDGDSLWARLEQARTLKRAHFPELYPEMLEVMRVHGELAALLLDAHLERHGAPSHVPVSERRERLATLHRRAHEAVAQLKRRCREVANLEGGPDVC